MIANIFRLVGAVCLILASFSVGVPGDEFNLVWFGIGVFFLGWVTWDEYIAAGRRRPTATP